MNWAPRVRLRTIFLFFLCAAVGLATYRDLLGAIEPAIATAMVIGLLQQSRQLRLWSPRDNKKCVLFARRFAVAWRLCLAIAIVGSVVIPLLDANGLLLLTDKQRVAVYFQILTSSSLISITTVLCNSLTRWRLARIDDAKHARWHWLIWIFAVALALLVTIDGSLTTYLVHRATAGIEADIPSQFRRPGVYPDFHAEGFRPFWIAIGATVSLVAGAATLIGLVRERGSKSLRKDKIVAVALLVTLPILFCAWYYSSEFHRISPDLAGAGLDANWVAWLVGAILAISAVTATSYYLGRANQFRATISTDLSLDIDSTAFHESALVLLLIGINSIYSLVLIALAMVNTGTTLGSPRPWFFMNMLLNPAVLLALAQIVAGLQLCWIRYRRRGESVPWELTGLSPRRFFVSWMLLALSLLVAIPTLSAFGFLAWLGPFNLNKLIGL